MNFPKRITVCEVSTRDGFQTLPPPTVAEKLTILDLIVKSGIHEIEVGSFVDKGSNLMCGMESTPEIFRVMERKQGVVYRALLQTPTAMRMAVDAGCEKIKLNISGSERHYQLMRNGASIGEGMKGFREIGALGCQHQVKILGSISLAFVSPYDDGMIHSEKIKEIIRAFIDSGATEISMNDTAGMSAPNQIFNRFLEMKVEFPEIQVWAFHAHNTRGTGLANTLAAMQAGVDRIDSSLAGIGGCPVFKKASGNISTEDLLYMLQTMGIDTGVDLERAIIAGEYISSLADPSTVDSYMQRLQKIKRERYGSVE